MLTLVIFEPRHGQPLTEPKSHVKFLQLNRVKLSSALEEVTIFKFN